ncbi:hypothetical protein J2S74_002695 [Evansella vedderi]|uniref:Uncharacterized protein n=1 Tax=Evansella vedderi TaxID=38282 RepID=A0ABT9ZVQ4_9BACI|nr:hypothetical protein [Evansella vedderi]MDQ0255313.1 hypothetical protein [Evansella vedderi]
MKKWVSAIISIAFISYAGYFFAQNVLGNTDEMLRYLEKTEQLTNDYFSLMDQELFVESEEELFTFTETVLVPGLEEILERSLMISEGIEKEKLKEVHEIHNDSIKLHIEAEKAWLRGEDSETLFEQSSELYFEYEEKLDSLAKKWGVEIEWQDWEEE